MNSFKTIARFLGITSLLYLLADVLFMKRSGVPVETRALLVDLAYGLLGLSAVFLLFYYYRTKQQAQFRQLAWFIAGALAVYLLLLFLS